MSNTLPPLQAESITDLAQIAGINITNMPEAEVHQVLTAALTKYKTQMNSTTIRTMLTSHSQIKVLQLNCNRKPIVIHGLLNEQFNKADILLLQEPS